MPEKKERGGRNAAPFCMSKKQEKHTVSVAVKTEPLPRVVLDQKTELLIEIRDMLKRFFDRVDSTGTLGK